MSPRKFTQFNGLISVGAVLLPLLVVPSPIGITSTKASQQESVAGQGRRMVIGVPAHVPLKFKVKNLDNKRWLHDLEIEVTNSSEKPIYFLNFYLVLPGMKDGVGNKLYFWLRYGRGQFLDFSTPVEKDDVPILPGEKYTLRLSESDAKQWNYVKDKQINPEPKVIGIKFHTLNFGDGSGFWGSDAAPLNIHRKIK
jgi:hypothetical protein